MVGACIILYVNKQNCAVLQKAYTCTPCGPTLGLKTDSHNVYSEVFILCFDEPRGCEVGDNDDDELNTDNICRRQSPLQYVDNFVAKHHRSSALSILPRDRLAVPAALCNIFDSTYGVGC